MRSFTFSFVVFAPHRLLFFSMISSSKSNRSAFGGLSSASGNGSDHFHSEINKQRVAKTYHRAEGQWIEPCI